MAAGLTLVILGAWILLQALAGDLALRLRNLFDNARSPTRRPGGGGGSVVFR